MHPSGKALAAGSGRIQNPRLASGASQSVTTAIGFDIDLDLLRVVRVRPGSWPQVQVPREEYLNDTSPEERFPTPAIFPKY